MLCRRERIHLARSKRDVSAVTVNPLGEDVELLGHLHSELLLLEPVGVADDSAEVLQQGGDVRQQQSGALS